MGGGKGKGGGGKGFAEGPPDSVVEMGAFQHAVEGDMLIKSTNEKVPYFNAPIYLENKSDVGKVDEILGTIQEVYFSVKPADGISATSFKPGDKRYINPEKLQRQQLRVRTLGLRGAEEDVWDLPAEEVWGAVGHHCAVRWRVE